MADNLTVTQGSSYDQFSLASASGQDGMSIASGTYTTESGTLSSDTPIDLDVISTAFFDADGGSAVIINDEVEQAFTYTGKNDTQLLGCEIASSTFAFDVGDRVNIA